MASVSKRKWTYKGQEREAWVVRYVDRGGKQRQHKCGSKKEADAYRATVETELLSGTHVAKGQGMKLGDLFNEFLNHYHRKVREGRVGSVGYDTTQNYIEYLRADFANVHLSDLTWQDVEKFHADFGKRRTKWGKPYARQTIVNIMDLFSRIIKWAVRRGYVARNVVQQAKEEIGSIPRKPIETFTREQVTQLLQTLERHHHKQQNRTAIQTKAIVYLGLACGLRRGEALALTWKHIDFDNGLIRIEQAITDKDVLKGPKTAAGRRVVPMAPPVAAALRDYAPFANEDERGLIFRTRYGGKLMGSVFHLNWRQILTYAELPPRHFHALRHFAGSAWLDAGISLADVSKLMGHANARVTAEIYTHALTEPADLANEMTAALTRVAPPPRLLIAQELRKSA